MKSSSKGNIISGVLIGCGILSLIVTAIAIVSILSYVHAKLRGSPLFPPKSLVTKSGKLKEDCEKYLKGSEKYIDMVNNAAEKYGVDPALVMGIIQQESGFNPYAKSQAGAMGMMQLMPGTASDMGVSNPYDAQQNIDGGTKYISQMMTKYKGNVAKATAAYNAGPGAVDKYGGVPPFAETQNYVDVVGANYKKYQECLQQQGSTNGTGLNSEIPADRQELIDKILQNKNIKFTYIANPDNLNKLDDKTLKLIYAAGENSNSPIYITAMTEGTHSVNSYHYIGQAVDFGVDDNLQNWLYNNQEELNIAELYGPNTQYQSKNGQDYPYFVSGHDNHIHVATK